MKQLRFEIQKIKLENKILRDRLKSLESRVKELEGLDGTVVNQMEAIAKKHRESRVEDKKEMSVEERESISEMIRLLESGAPFGAGE
jgi:predicted  nucleic acid-binding Zn-ribbon protein